MIPVRRLAAGGLILLTLLTAGCYHMRFTAKEVPPPEFNVSVPPATAFRRVEQILATDGFSLEMDDPDRLVILTGLRFFYNDSGFGQPPGGRNYFHKLRVVLCPDRKGTRVELSDTALEIQSFYLYENEGELVTLKKHYPYEEYPGMFDLDAVKAELARVSAKLQRGMNEW